MTILLLAAALAQATLNPVEIGEAPSHAALALVKDGRADVRIVEEGESTAKAAAVLRRAFEKAGVLVGNKGRYVLRLVGDGDWHKERFTVTTSADGVTIAGNVLWGAYDFVERFLGARYYYMGEAGESHPPVRSLVLEPCAYADEPKLVNRGTYTLDGAINMKKMAKTLGAELTKEDFRRFRESHRLADTDPFRIMHEPNPVKWTAAHTNLIPNLIETSFFRNVQGKRYQTFNGHMGNYFDVTSFDFVENLIATYKRYYTLSSSAARRASGFRYLNSKYVVFGQCDNELRLVEMQENPVVKREGLVTEAHVARGRGGYFSDVYARFFKRLAERLAEELPGKKLIVMPYQGYTLAPLQERFFLPENVDVGVCLSSMPRFVRNKEAKEQARTRLAEWFRALKGRPVQQTWGYASGNNLFTEAVAFNYEGEFIREMGPLLGVHGIFQEVPPKANPVTATDSTQGLFHYEMYVMARQFWNPAFDVRAALDEYFERMYGPAAEVLKRFYGRLVGAYEKFAVPEKKADALYPVKVLDALEADLDAAKKLLAAGTPERKRFDLFEKPFRWQIKAQRGRHAFTVMQTLANRTTATIAVDGCGTEADWAAAVPAVMMRADGTGDAPTHAPDARFLWDESGVYGLVVQKAAPEKSNADMWRNDTVEIIFAPGLDKERIFQVAVDPNGRVYTAKRVLKPIPLERDRTWKCDGMREARTETDGGWTVEFFIPFSALEATPVAYESWNYLLAYTRRKEGEDVSVTSLTLGNNRNADRYGVLKFLGRPLKPSAAPYAKPGRYKGYRQSDRVYDATASVANPANFYSMSLLTFKPDKHGETDTFFFLTSPRRKGGFGQASVKFLSLTVNGVPLSRTNPSDALRTAADGAPAWHLGFDGAGLVVEARQKPDDPLLYLTFRRDPASVRPIESAEIRLRCAVSSLGGKKRHDRFARTKTRSFGGTGAKARTALAPEDGYLMLGDRLLDGSSKDCGWGPSLIRFPANWTGVKSIDFTNPKSTAATVRVTLDPATFDSLTLGILQTQDRVDNRAFEAKYLGERGSRSR